MPLSEHEEHVLAEIERQLVDEDPRFVARARRARRPRSLRGHRLGLAITVFALGLLSMFGLVVHIAFGVVGFALMFTSVIVAVPEVQRRHEAHIDHQRQA